MSGRRPLGDATVRANNAQGLPRHLLPQSQTPTLPHHESLKANGDLAVREVPDHAMRGAENPRLSAVVGEDQHNSSNRNSQISTTSTNASGKSRRKTHVGPWQLGATLGRGATARVRKARHAVTGQAAAIKIVSKAAAASVQRRTSMKGKGLPTEDPRGPKQMPFGIEREVVIMKLIEHPNVIQLYDIWENRGELYLVLEYVKGGELFDYLVQAGHFPEHEAIRYFRQILAGLTYCHHFSICHRDLKPENILMDRDKNVKLADFGMAALQPENHLLNTSCGSPNYAAPEILEGKQYHGSDVDIWSCGVVLYAMLVGRTPFDDVDVPSILRNIKAGRFDMPSRLSPEAQDLLRNMLQINPTRRIKMDQIWRHPLLTKYDVVYAIDGTVVRNAGPPAMPPMQDMAQPLKSKADVDGELLRNLQTLWHGETEQMLVQKLLTEEANQEKFFYYLLLKYREKHLEDYPGPSLEYSASDYHHNRPARKKRAPQRSANALSRAQGRQGSQFSIVSDGNVRSKARRSYYEDPDTAATVESYDPFRSSRNPVHVAEAKYANVTVLRGQSNASREAQQSLAPPAVTKLYPGSTSLSHGSITSASRPLTPSQRKSSLSRLGSKGSLASSARRGSSPAVIRPSSSHKRGVSFAHLRKPGPAEASSSTRQGARSRVEQRHERSHGRSRGAQVTVIETSSSPPTESNITPRPRRGTTNARPGSAGQKTTAPSVMWREEARQVSSELEKFCEEAFNRSSVSSARTTATEAVVAYDTPISTFSARDESPLLRKGPVKPSAPSPVERPLPAPPLIVMDAYTEQQLLATRDRLKQRAIEGSAGASQEYLDDVIAHLDRLLAPAPFQATAPDQGRRYVSASADCRSPAETNHLPSISEERHGDYHDLRRMKHRAQQGQRTSSEPTGTATVPSTSQERDFAYAAFHRSSPAPVTPVAPLNVRKRSTQQVVSPLKRVEDRAKPEPEPAPHPEPERAPEDSDSQSSWIRDYVTRQRDAPLQTVREQDSPDDVVMQRPRMTSGEGKKFGWFKRNQAATYVPSPSIVETTSPWEANDASAIRPTSNIASENTGGSGECGRRPTSGFGKKGLMKIFHRLKSGEEKPEISLSVATMDDAMSPEGSRTSSNKDSRLRRIRPQQTWFTRMLHIKPASKLLCFTVGKVRARQEVASILKAWKKYGLRDVVVDRARSLIFGRVDVKNYLGLKPVSFACEILAVVEHGKRARFSIARFTQEKGAASSFYKVVETLETMLARRDLLITDELRRKAMERILP
ncbi:MAG: hypothetical protein M1838_001255 [Thelocarpon superellum]|nr:MAG: hypothetical protein M1838_001255 [Thelocarpon superellum]